LLVSDGSPEVSSIFARNQSADSADPNRAYLLIDKAVGKRMWQVVPSIVPFGPKV